MSSDACGAMISIRGLGKRYRLGQTLRHDTLRDAIAERARLVFRRAGESQHKPARAEEFWALRDVTFDVNEGEVVGLIGRNGAGKSTLLKILSEITEPTSGEVRLRGRVASLLEVGAGFHPELTGRENIYLNGAILGMTRAEIRRKFDEIVAFAEIEPFLGTPVKRYSSGMYVRLAFAVAAHLESEILIVDEVLAVGDLAFQKKCLGKMGEVARGGRTAIFVSHAMASVQSLCSRAVVLHAGRVSFDGPVNEALLVYLEAGADATGGKIDLAARRRGGCDPVIESAALLDESGEPAACVPVGASLRFRLQLNPARRVARPVFGIGVDNHLGQRVVGFNSVMNSMLEIDVIEGPTTIECAIPEAPLAPGVYHVKLVVSDPGGDVDVIDQALRFSVEPTDWYGSGRLPAAHQGFFVCRAHWSCPAEAPAC